MHMQKKIAIIISPNWRDYASLYLADCIRSVRALEGSDEHGIFLVDNNSTDESYSFLRSTVPEATVIRNVHNDGFAKGNNDAIRAALEMQYEYVMLLNMDTIIEPDCIRKLLAAMEKDNSIGALQAQLMLWPDRNKINTLGNITHFLGFGYTSGYMDTINDKTPPASRDISYPSGAAMFIKTSALRKVGLFDEEYWMYNEDQDLGWRLWLAGYKCRLCSGAIVYHKYDFSRNPVKYYYVDRNRLLSIFKNFHHITLMLIFPALLAMEAGLILFSIKNHWFGDKVRVYGYFLTPSRIVRLFRERRRSQKLRTVRDRDISHLISGTIEHETLKSPLLNLVNPVFSFYWKCVKLIMFW